MTIIFAKWIEYVLNVLQWTIRLCAPSCLCLCLSYEVWRSYNKTDIFVCDLFEGEISS
jgi:hypothetical protein